MGRFDPSNELFIGHGCSGVSLGSWNQKEIRCGRFIK